MRLVRGLEPPLQHPDVRVQGERLGRILESDLRPDLEQLLVDVRMRLELDPLVVRVGQLEFDPAEGLLRDAEGQHAGDLHVLQAAVTVGGHHDLLLHLGVDTAKKKKRRNNSSLK